MLHSPSTYRVLWGYQTVLRWLNIPRLETTSCTLRYPRDPYDHSVWKQADTVYQVVVISCWVYRRRHMPFGISTNTTVTLHQSTTILDLADTTPLVITVLRRVCG